MRLMKKNGRGGKLGTLNKNESLGKKNEKKIAAIAKLGEKEEIHKSSVWVKK